MNDAGPGSPAATDRCFTNEEMWRATEQIVETAVLCDDLGYDSFWLTEHHFQYEGYEVVPNGVLLGTVIAERTEKIRIGMAFNVIPQWHPLRFAEDFATLHNISRGRGILGVGRGTVPREAETLGTRIGSFDNPDQAVADEINRKQFDEAMDVIQLALTQEKFSYHGDVYSVPPPGIPDRGGTVQELTLVPRPLYPFDTWQAVTSPPTLEQVPTRGWGGVFWNSHPTFLKHSWSRFAEVFEESHGRQLSSGENRMLVRCVCVADTYEEAVAKVRPGHDEMWKFLGPYGWSKGYMGPDGKPSPSGLIPSLEESIDQKIWLVGTPDDVGEQIQWYRDLLGVENLLLFPMMPGDTYSSGEEQIRRLAEDVLPKFD